jgi:hypothetical protein
VHVVAVSFCLLLQVATYGSGKPDFAGACGQDQGVIMQLMLHDALPAAAGVRVCQRQA